MKNINFAQTFKPEKQYLTCILKLAQKETTMTTKQISLETGIPTGEKSGKVIPHIEYSKFMGLINYEKLDACTFKLLITDLGKKILEEDPGMREELTLILLHSMLCRFNSGAPFWDVMYQIIFPKYHGKISIDDVQKELNVIYKNKVTRKNFAPFICSYDDVFASICYMRHEAQTLTLSYSSKIDKDFVYAYGFILFSYWDELYNERLEITADEFLKLQYGTKLNFDSKTEYMVLELLNDSGIIRLNRQLTPYTIMKLTNQVDLLKQLYSELF